MRGKIHSNGYWEGSESSSQHKHDPSLSSALVEFFREENIDTLVDFGCGMGKYVEHFNDCNINACGYDGNPNTPDMTNNTCLVLDLSVPKKFDKPFSWVMSLEVGEHLPRQFEDIFIGNLHNNNEKGIVLSWALKGQGGDGHFNEQNNDYIKRKICKLGYENDTNAEQVLRESSSLWWFKNTIMVFRKV